MRLSYGKPLGLRVKKLGRLPAKVIPNLQYSSGNKNVVALRSASVMTQNFVPLLIV